MTPGLPLPALDSSITVALLVAADAAAPGTAWAVARAAAADRQTALIDLALGEGALDAGADDPGAEGIVDVFEFGASWNHVARRQGADNLYFVSDGTPAADPHAVWGHARWEKLKRGFQQQGALLLLFVPARALADLAPRADAVVLLGEGPAAETARSVAAGRGLPLHGPVVRQPPAAPARPEPAAVDAPARARWIPWVVGVVVALTVFATAFALLRPDRSRPAPVAETPDPSPPPAAEAAPAPAAPAPAPVAASPVAPAGDTLFYAVQVAAFSRMAPARALADDLERGGRIVAITPVLINRAVWYRVLVGALPTASAASRARAALWDRGLLERRQGAVLRVPHAWALAVHGDEDAATMLAGLRQSGIPAYIVSGPDAPQLYLGAFETPEQAAAAESLLTVAGRPHTLVARRGTAQ